MERIKQVCKIKSGTKNREEELPKEKDVIDTSKKVTNWTLHP